MEKLEVAIILTVEEVNAIIGMMSERPFKDVIGLFMKLRNQADKQVADITKRAEMAQQEANHDLAAAIVDEPVADPLPAPAAENGSARPGSSRRRPQSRESH